jgi:hypothetical protein
MRQSLREVPEEVSCLDVDLLGVQPDVVREPDELVHQRAGFVEAALVDVGFGEPERAGDERAVLARQPVVTDVAMEKRAVPELAPHRVDGSE